MLCGCADQADVALFDVGKKGVLLGFVEAMNFIDKYDRSSAKVAGFGGVGHDLLDLFDSAQNGGEFDEISFRDSGDDLRKSCLSHSGRTPEDDGTRIVSLDLQTERLARREQMLLSYDFIESSGTHALGERSGSRSRGFPIWKGGEEAHRTALR